MATKPPVMMPMAPKAPAAPTMAPSHAKRANAGTKHNVQTMKPTYHD